MKENKSNRKKQKRRVSPQPQKNFSLPPLTEAPAQVPIIKRFSEQQAITYKPIIPDMEVHHPHPVHHSKKWKDYLFEFLMLFLAVTLGFFVENQREHYIERQREKQFIRSLVNDIIADTAKLNSIINRRTAREHSLDSLNFLLNSDSAGTHTNDLYYFASTASRSLLFRFVSNDGTMQQLKNSGAFRLIRSRIIADSIANYDVSIRNVLRQQELEEIFIHDYRQAAAKIFDALIFDQMMGVDIIPRRLEGNPALLNYNKDDLQNWNYKIFSMKTLSKGIRRDNRLLLMQAKNLLTTLKKEYDLK
jgi:hypothetical protein